MLEDAREGGGVGEVVGRAEAGAADLAIALGLVAVWMLIDARKHGLSITPYLLLTATLGSAGPLLYLIRREWAIRGR